MAKEEGKDAHLYSRPPGREMSELHPCLHHQHERQGLNRHIHTAVPKKIITSSELKTKPLCAFQINQGHDQIIPGSVAGEAYSSNYNDLGREFRIPDMIMGVERQHVVYTTWNTAGQFDLYPLSRMCRTGLIKSPERVHMLGVGVGCSLVTRLITSLCINVNKHTVRSILHNYLWSHPRYSRQMTSVGSKNKTLFHASFCRQSRKQFPEYIQAHCQLGEQIPHTSMQSKKNYNLQTYQNFTAQTLGADYIWRHTN